ncbi:hypothetical protein E2C16_03965 [Sporosarcina pasteurii]|nr:hypothetical protein E2C16_03965 [Sporosarcina pasteurii]
MCFNNQERNSALCQCGCQSLKLIREQPPLQI